MPELHELPDGSLIAYFDAEGDMIDDPNKAETAIINKPDGTLIHAVRASADAGAQDEGGAEQDVAAEGTTEE